MILFAPCHRMQVSLPSCLCTAPSTRGLISPALSCQGGTPKFLGQQRGESFTLAMCLSNLLPTRPWNAQQLLLLELNPSFLPCNVGTSQWWQDLHRLCTRTSLTTSTNHKAFAASDSWLSFQKCLGLILEIDKIL